MADIERFSIEGQLGRGGTSTVFKARDADTGAMVALKVIDRSDRESRLRFERETSILAHLEHPAIVRYIAHGETRDGRRYLAMDWVEGETLYARLARVGLSIVETIEVGRQVARALDHAHTYGVVHRDIKPSNLIARNGDLARVAVLDFGVARVAGMSSGTLTETGALIGTPSYMAPEQARGEREIGPRVDVFGLGCVLYECATGRMAFEGTHVLALVAKVVLWDPPRARTINRDLPPALDDLIAAMLAKDADARPASGAEVAARLDAIPRETLRDLPRRGRPAVGATLVGVGRPARSAHAGRPVSLVVATPMTDADGTTPVLSPEDIAARRDALAASLASFDVRLEVLYDGSILVIVVGSGVRAIDLAARAILSARAIRSALPDVLVAVASGEIADDSDRADEALLETAVKALAREAMAVVFASVSAPGRPAGAIRLDDGTARLIGDPTVRVGNVSYVLGA